MYEYVSLCVCVMRNGERQSCNMINQRGKSGLFIQLKLYCISQLFAGGYIRWKHCLLANKHSLSQFMNCKHSSQHQLQRKQTTLPFSLVLLLLTQSFRWKDASLPALGLVQCTHRCLAQITNMYNSIDAKLSLGISLTSQ